jgi:hypothetical protein
MVYIQMHQVLHGILIPVGALLQGLGYIQVDNDWYHGKVSIRKTLLILGDNILHGERGAGVKNRLDAATKAGSNAVRELPECTPGPQLDYTSVWPVGCQARMLPTDRNLRVTQCVRESKRIFVRQQTYLAQLFTALPALPTRFPVWVRVGWAP